MITIHGYLGQPADAARADCAQADLVVGSERALDALGVPAERRLILGPLGPAAERLAQLRDDEHAVVLASGDPLFHGVVRYLRRQGVACRVVPAVSSVAAAFAAVALPWDDALVVSAHRDDLPAAVEACRRHPKVAVLTAPGRGAPQLAAGLIDLPGPLPRWLVIAERLGEPDERVRVVEAARAVGLTDVADPHVVLCLAHHPDDPAGWDTRRGAPTQDGAERPSAAEAAPRDETRPGQGANPAATGAQSAGAPSVDEPDEQAALPTARVGQIVSSPASRRRAAEIDAILDSPTTWYDGPAVQGLPSAYAECDLLVSHLALGATTRILAPLLRDKRTDPGVVVVDEAGRFVVPLVGGHAGGANELARRLADGLGATAVVTTATDSLGVPALDTLGWPYVGDVAGVTRAILDEKPVRLVREYRCPLPALPQNVIDSAPGTGDPTTPQVVVTDRCADTVLAEAAAPTVVVHPPSLIVGLGCNRGTPVEQVEQLVATTLAEAGLALASVAALTTIDLKAGEVGFVQLASRLGVPLRDFPAEVLATQPVPTPSAVVDGHVGSPSVSEASVLAEGAHLVVAKRKSTDATCAVGRRPARGRLSVVGLGPGSRDLLTPKAVEAIRGAAFVVGYGPYVRQIRDLIRPGARVHASKMGTEQERTGAAIAAARAGESVAVVCSGDPAVYAMASPILEQGTEGIDVVIVPGVTAGLAASAILGAPLGHDHAVISLSDLHTDWDTIERRLHAAAEGDLVTVMYNPRSKNRREHLPRAMEILAGHREASTPVAIVRQAYRRQQAVTLATVGTFDPEAVDMTSLVIVGSRTTRLVASGGGEQRMITPRDYRWLA